MKIQKEESEHRIAMDIVRMGIENRSPADKKNGTAIFVQQAQGNNGKEHKLISW